MGRGNGLDTPTSQLIARCKMGELPSLIDNNGAMIKMSFELLLHLFYSSELHLYNSEYIALHLYILHCIVNTVVLL